MPMRAAAFAKLVGMLLLVAGVAVPSTAQELVVTEQNDGGSVEAVLGQTILVDLRGNASTGFSWLLISHQGDSVVVTGPSEYIEDPGGGSGRPGTFSFPFRAAELGVTTLTLHYLQPWDPASVLQTFSITITVRAEAPGPRLSIALVGTDAVISWPQAGSDGFILEGTQSLSAPNWAVLNALPLPVGSDYQVTLAAAGQALFFRLRN